MNTKVTFVKQESQGGFWHSCWSQKNNWMWADYRFEMLSWIFKYIILHDFVILKSTISQRFHTNSKTGSLIFNAQLSPNIKSIHCFKSCLLQFNLDKPKIIKVQTEVFITVIITLNIETEPVNESRMIRSMCIDLCSLFSTIRFLLISGILRIYQHLLNP